MLSSFFSRPDDFWLSIFNRIYIFSGAFGGCIVFAGFLANNVFGLASVAFWGNIIAVLCGLVVAVSSIFGYVYSGKVTRSLKRDISDARIVAEQAIAKSEASKTERAKLELRIESMKSQNHQMLERIQRIVADREPREIQSQVAFKISQELRLNLSDSAIELIVAAQETEAIQFANQLHDIFRRAGMAVNYHSTDEFTAEGCGIFVRQGEAVPVVAQEIIETFRKHKVFWFGIVPVRQFVGTNSFFAFVGAKKVNSV